VTHRGISYKEIRGKNKDRRPQSQSENKVKKDFTEVHRQKPKQPQTGKTTEAQPAEKTQYS